MDSSLVSSYDQNLPRTTPVWSNILLKITFFSLISLQSEFMKSIWTDYSLKDSLSINKLGLASSSFKVSIYSKKANVNIVFFFHIG